MKDKASFTDEEVAELRKRSQAIFSKAESDAPIGDTFLIGVLTGPDVFKNPNATANALDVDIPEIDNRTSLVIDPPDGRLPEYTAAGADRNAALRRALLESMPSDPEMLPNAYRCLYCGTPRLLRGFLSLTQIVVTRDFVVFNQEYIHEARIVPLDGRPHLPANVRLIAGDPRGHWEGKTLVVETTNFSRQNNVLGSDENLQIVERFTRVGPTDIEYIVTVIDPTVWTRPWTAKVRLTKTSDDGLIEAACHEGNHSMRHILSGARAMERNSAPQ